MPSLLCYFSFATRPIYAAQIFFDEWLSIGAWSTSQEILSGKSGGGRNMNMIKTCCTQFSKTYMCVYLCKHICVYVWMYVCTFIENWSLLLMGYQFSVYIYNISVQMPGIKSFNLSVSNLLGNTMLFSRLSMKTWFVYSSCVLDELSWEVIKIEKMIISRLLHETWLDFLVFNE